jgi:hypothetical protein
MRDDHQRAVHTTAPAHNLTMAREQNRHVRLLAAHRRAPNDMRHVPRRRA